MRTVYVVVKDGMIQDAYADHLTDLVILDYDTQDEQMIAGLDVKVAELQKDGMVVEIY